MNERWALLAFASSSVSILPAIRSRRSSSLICCSSMLVWGSARTPRLRSAITLLLLASRVHRSYVWLPALRALVVFGWRAHAVGGPTLQLGAELRQGVAAGGFAVLVQIQCCL